MSGEYNINWTDDQSGANPQKPRFVINPNETDGPGNATSNSPLQLPGRFTINYGEMIAEDLLHLLENFSSSTSPPNPTSGMLWFNSLSSILYVRNTANTEWVRSAQSAVGAKWGTSGEQITSFTAEPEMNYFVNTAAGSITATLPLSPDVGDVVGFIDQMGTFNINTLVVDGNGSNIMGLASQMINDVQNNSFRLVYSPQPSRGWIIAN